MGTIEYTTFSASIGWTIPNRLMTNVLSLAFCVVSLLCLAPSPSSAQTQNVSPARILYINAYHPGYKWSDDIENALISSFKSSSREIELSIVYLDSRRFSDDRQVAQWAEVIESKYADYPFELVITSDNTAYNFATRHRDRLFPNLPIVFSGYNNLRSEMLRGIPNITGVNEQVDFSATIDLALSLHPDTRTLAFVVSTHSASALRNYKPLVEDIFPKYRDDYDLIELKDLSLEKINAEFGRLPAKSLVFVVGVASEEGQPLSPVENNRKIAGISTAPVYTFWNFALGTGVVGGQFLTGTDQGRVAAEMALKILDGVSTDDIPVVLKSPSTPMFDFSAMSRFGIDAERLPPNSTIINRPHSVWELYRGQIITAFAAFLFLSILIVALIIALRQRRQALEKEKEYSALQRQFVSLVSHEFRTPLAIIDGSAQRVIRLKDEITPDQLVERNGKIRFAVERMVGLIESTLYASRLDASTIEIHIQPCRIRYLLDEICDRQGEISPSYDIRVDLDGIPEHIDADPKLLEHVFTNLLSNAVKYAPDSPLIEVIGQVDGDTALFSIKDRGLGISEDDLPHMFERFFRAKTAQGIQGTGIGLSVCREFVEMHGGTIEVASVEGEGSTITVRLPIDVKSQ